MLCLRGFELYSCWVSLTHAIYKYKAGSDLHFKEIKDDWVGCYDWGLGCKPFWSQIVWKRSKTKTIVRKLSRTFI